jgi:putative transposase
MWTEQQRARHKVTVSKQRLSDRHQRHEWKLVEPLLPGTARTGRLRKTELRRVIDTLRYLVRSGCEWRMLPNDFPPYQTVYYWFRPSAT